MSVPGLGGYSRVDRTAEVTAVLGNAGVFNGAAVDTSADKDGAQGVYDVFRAQVFADQIGTLNIQQSRDGTAWRTTDTSAIAVNTTLTLESKIVRRYVRASVTNGATPQTVFELDTAPVAR